MTNDMNIKATSQLPIAPVAHARSKSPEVSPESKIRPENVQSVQDSVKIKKELEESDKPDRKDELSQIDEAVTSLNSSIQTVQRNLQFSVDKDLDKIVINVKDKQTDEVVRQIPSEEVLELARNLHDMVESRRDKSSSSAEGVFFSSSA